MKTDRNGYAPLEIDCISTLTRRALYLRKKTRAAPGQESQGVLYDQVELKALEWALGKLGHPLPIGEGKNEG